MSKPAAGPVIFIDVDGVPNACNQPDDPDLFFPSGREAEMRDSYLVLSASRLSRFAELVKAHDCRIVLSTSWRLMALARTVLLAAFAEHGIEARVLGDTPDRRGQRMLYQYLDAAGVHLKKLFNDMDDDKSGTLSRDEARATRARERRARE